MKVYLDTEFTDFKNGKLISIGLISCDGERSFYAELTGNYTEQDCSDFVLDVVLPLLDAPELPAEIDYKAIYAKMTIDQTRYHLNAWFERLQEPVIVVIDSGFDYEFLYDLFRNHPWPAMVDQEPESVILGDCEWMQYEVATERLFTHHSEFRRHHALDDAKVMRIVTSRINSKG